MSESPQPSIEPLAERVHERRLANGIRLLVMRRGDAPVAAFHTYVDVGSVDEPAGRSGIAHMFEHMAFKGSRRVGSKDWTREAAAMDGEERAYLAWRAARERSAPESGALHEQFMQASAGAASFVETNEYWSALGRAGGNGLNATTSADCTRYFVSFPANKLETWAWLESERFSDPVLREFYKERDVVQEERRLSTDSNPSGKLIEAALIEAFRGHPYGRPVIGFMEDLQRFSRSEAEEFYKQTYGPSKMIISVVGRVDPAEVADTVERYFSRIAPNSPAASPADPPLEPTGARRVEVPFDAEPAFLALYRRPPAHHPDDPAYDALADLLGGGAFSRLYRALVKTGKAATAYAYSSFPGAKYSTGFGIYALPGAAGSVEEIEAVCDSEIAALVERGPTPEEMSAVSRRTQTVLLRRFDSNMGIARELAAFESIGGGWRRAFRQWNELRAVDAERVRALAEHTLTPRNRTIAVIRSTRTP